MYPARCLSVSILISTVLLASCRPDASLGKDDASVSTASSAATETVPAPVNAVSAAKEPTERPAYVVATAKQYLSVTNFGPQVVVRGPGGLYTADDGGRLVVSSVKKGLKGRRDSEVIGLGLDDAWAITSETRGDRSHEYSTIHHREKERWSPVTLDVSLSDSGSGTAPGGLVATSPGTAVLLLEKSVGIDTDGFTTMHDGKGTTLKAGSLLAEAWRPEKEPKGRGNQALLGVPSGDVYASANGVLVRLPPGGQEMGIPLPAPPEGVQALEVTLLASGPESSIAAAFEGTRAGSSWIAVATLRGTKWDALVVPPAADALSHLAVSPDGALWMGNTKGKVWRYLAGSASPWETIAMPVKDLEAAGIPEGDPHVTGIVASAADDVWISLGQGGEGESTRPGGMLLRTKPSGSVQRLGGSKVR